MFVYTLQIYYWVLEFCSSIVENISTRNLSCSFSKRTTNFQSERTVKTVLQRHLLKTVNCPLIDTKLTRYTLLWTKLKIDLNFDFYNVFSKNVHHCCMYLICIDIFVCVIYKSLILSHFVPFGSFVFLQLDSFLIVRNIARFH